MCSRSLLSKLVAQQKRKEKKNNLVTGCIAHTRGPRCTQKVVFLIGTLATIDIKSLLWLWGVLYSWRHGNMQGKLLEF